MAIQFSCPNCSAPIRVPDTAAGKKGNCPKCNTAVIVPHVDRSGSPESPQTVPAPSPPPPGPPPQDEAFPDVTKRKVVKKVIKKVKKVVKKVPAAVPPGTEARETPEDYTVVEEEVSPFEAAALGATEPVAEKSVARKKTTRRGRRRKSAFSAFAVPIVCLLILGGGVGWFLWNMNQESAVSGQIQAVQVINPPVYAVTIKSGEIELPSEQVSAALEGLKEPGLHMAEASMKTMEVVLAGTEEGLTVQVNQDIGGKWVRIDPTADDALKTYVRKHREEWDQLRLEKLEKSLKQLLPKWEDAKKPEYAISFRDDIALNRSVGGFGFVVEAREGSRVHRTAYEDNEGRIYFLLPKDAASFTLQGRKLDNGSQPFQGKFTVKLAGEPEQGLNKPANGDQNSPGSDPRNNDAPSFSELLKKKDDKKDKEAPGLNEMQDKKEE